MGSLELDIFHSIALRLASSYMMAQRYVLCASKARVEDLQVLVDATQSGARFWA
jgi:hypothetical protein